MSQKFTVDLGWAALLDALGIGAGDLLKAAELPADLFARERPQLEPEAFFRLWRALELQLGEDAGLKLGCAVDTAAFSPPLFAAFCSPDLTAALSRLAQYKPLIGPMRLGLSEVEDGLLMNCETLEGIRLPQEFAAAELVFLVHLARLATRTHVVPHRVAMREPPYGSNYDAFFGVSVETGPQDGLVFALEDASRPFLSANPALFAMFDAGLRARLDELRRDASMTARVQAALMEALPAARADVGQIARDLGVSTRSMQRRLNGEGTSFQAELARLRERLARDYLTRTRHTSAEIAFLLGYVDPNSFIRAFHDWTGTTPEALRVGRA